MNAQPNRTVDRAKHLRLGREIRARSARRNEKNTVWFVDDANTEEVEIREYFQVAPPERVIAMVKAGHIPKLHNVYGSPIVLAAELGLFDLIKPLHQLDCSLNAKGQWDGNALNSALLNSTLDPTAQTVINLLDIGADLEDRGTPLCCAASRSEAHVVRALLLRGLDPNEHDAIPAGYGDSPLLAILRAATGAPQGPHRVLPIVEELLAAGADPNALCHCFPRGDSEDAGTHSTHDVLPVQMLAKIKRLPSRDAAELVRVLVAHGMILNHQHSHLHHPLTICAREGNDTMARAMLEHGADPDLAIRDRSRKYFVETAGRFQIAPVELFAMNGMAQCTAFLLDRFKADPEHMGADGVPLVDAVKDNATKEILRSAITAKIIDQVLGDAPPSRTGARKTNFSL